jgi:DTW domain-containing protein YfiP
MARSVVLNPTVRCEHCRFAPRWCICAGFQAVACPLQVDVLMHWREASRPTSTGRLINRVLPASRRHVFRPETPPARAAIAVPGRELWILHPRGEALSAAARPEQVQVLLLDGSWRESVPMAQAVAAWGRLVRLPAAGPSRNALRRQDAPGQYATVEALLFLLAALGLAEAEAGLRRQFELHVYAGLRTRGAKAQAAAFLATSSLREAFPDLMQELDRRRPNEGGCGWGGSRGGAEPRRF